MWRASKLNVKIDEFGNQLFFYLSYNFSFVNDLFFPAKEEVLCCCSGFVHFNHFNHIHIQSLQQLYTQNSRLL